MSDGYTAADRERWAPEPSKRPGRGDFARDRARVLHSSALRRLGAKTQVVGPGTDDFARTRLTHSLEVAQVGRELAAALGCHPDVVDAACLAHDLGHPPFGHHGEQVLAELAAGIGGFEGNAQTLRLLTRLEPKVVLQTPQRPPRPAGLNLTRASLDAATKYPWRRGESPAGGPKFGVYDDDLEVFGWLRAGAPDGRRSFEAQVMDLADDVAYSVHDVEDAVVGGWLDPAALATDSARGQVVATAVGTYLPGAREQDAVEALDRLRAAPYWVDSFDGGRPCLAALKDMTSQLIGRFCDAAEQATRARFGPGRLTRYGADVVVPSATLAEIAVLKATAAVFVMRAKGRRAVYDRQRRIVTELTEALVDAGPGALEPAYAADLRAAEDDAARLRTVIDQVAVLTDDSAQSWHRRLCGPRRSRPTT